MNKVLFFSATFFIACCCIGLSISLQCNICESLLGQNCNDSRSAKCDPALTQQTVTYALTHLKVNETSLNSTSSTYACVNYFISTSNGSQSYLGCFHSAMSICSFEPRQFQWDECSSCNTDNCNNNTLHCGTPSITGRATSYTACSFITLTASIILALIAKVSLV